MGDSAEADRPIAVVGAGAMGRALGVLLTAAGCPVTLLTREGTASALLAAGAMRATGLVQRNVAVRSSQGSAGTLGVTSEPVELPDGAGVIFATKGPQLAAAVHSVAAGQRAAGRSPAWAGGVQNGVVKDDILTEAFGAGRVIRLVSTLNSRLDESGSAVVTGLGSTYVGARAGHDPDAELLVRGLAQVGIPVQLLDLDQIVSLIWMKCINAIGIFGVGCLCRLPGNVAFTRRPLVQAYLDLVREAAAVCTAEGVGLADFAGMAIRTKLEQDPEITIAEMIAEMKMLEGGPPAYSSMAQDVIHGRPTEADAVFGDLVARAARLGVVVPRIALAYDILAGLQP